MAVTIAEITKLRKLSGAGMMDCKKALEESNGDIEKAMEIIRKKGQAVAAKRSDREASEGCVLVKAENGFGAIIALKCETDFVAKNEDFVKLNQQIIDAAVAAKAKSLDEIKGLMLGNETVADAIIARSGITGENIVWHRSCDEFLKQAFKERSSGLSLMYGLSDLGGNGLAAVESNGDIQYLYIPEADDTGVSPATREECARDDSVQLSLWYYFDTRPHLELTEPEEEKQDDKKLGKINPDIDRQIAEIWGTSGDAEN